MSSPIPDIPQQQPAAVTGPAAPPIPDGTTIGPAVDPTAWLTAIATHAADDAVSGRWQAVLADLADLKARAAAHPEQVAALEGRIAALEANPARAVADAVSVAGMLAGHRDAILAEIRTLAQSGYKAAGAVERRWIRYGVALVGIAIIVVCGALAIAGNDYLRAHATEAITLGAFFIGLAVDLT